jgi:hypothetical protein
MYSTAAYSASATFTPAAASHTGGDVHGGAQEFALLDRLGGAIPTGASVRITSVTMRVDGATIETTAWRLHLYNVTPPSAIADDGAFDVGAGGTAAADRAAYLGYVDISQVLDLGTTLYIDMPNLNKQCKLAGTSLFGYLVNITTLTPQAVPHVVTLHCVAV